MKIDFKKVRAIMGQLNRVLALLKQHIKREQNFCLGFSADNRKSRNALEIKGPFFR